MQSKRLSTRWMAVAALLSGLGFGGTADALPFSGTFTLVLELPIPAPYNPVVFAGLVSGSATVAPDGRSFQLPAGIVAINGLVANPAFTYTPTTLSFAMTADNGAGSFAANNGPFGGTMPLSGVIKICVFGGVVCGGGPNQPGEIPLGGVGVGGSATATGVLNITTLGAAWIAAPVTIPDANGSHQVIGFAQGPASNTSTIGAGGRIQLVTPMVIQTRNPVDELTTLYATARLNLVFTPEPGSLVLIGGGIAAIGWGGVRRRR